MNVKVLVGPNQKRLRYLDEEKTTNITGIGKRNDTIEIIIFFNDFEFSGNETFPPNETIKANLMNISTEQRIISWRHCCYCSCYFLCGCCCYSCSFIVENWLKSTYEG